MAKGCCGGSGTCSCQIIGHGAVNVSGSGQPDSPFILDVDLDFESSANKTFITLIMGDGSDAAPYSPVVTFADTAELDDLPDVQAPSPTNGQVLAWDSAQAAWMPTAPTTAATGAVLHDTSLTGDGSAPTPLAVVSAPTRFLGTFAAGLGLTDIGMASTTQRFIDSTARAAAIPSPMLNQMTMLDSAPGVIEYWTGSDWDPLPGQTLWENVNGALLELSGPYSPGLQPTVMVLQVNTTTDAFGDFDVLGTPELAGRSGVLTAMFSEAGGTPWKAVLNPVSNKIVGTAYRLTDGTVMAGTPVAGTAQAILY